MEAIKTFFQDASNACAYANECAPDFSFLSFLKPHEPYTALIAVAISCYLAWSWNERRIAGRASKPATGETVPATDARELTATLDEMKSEPERKLAA